MTNHIPSPRPDPDDRWNALTDELADCLPEIGENMCVILAHRAVNHYVQVAGSDNGDLRLEAASNTYIEPPSALLTVAQYTRMYQLGRHWRTDSFSATMMKFPFRYAPMIAIADIDFFSVIARSRARARWPRRRGHPT